MKTYKNLFAQIISFENILLASYKAAKGKRERYYVIDFFIKLEENIYRLQRELLQQSYYPGGYTTFRIYNTKPRKISAAPFRDRVVHHALINVIGPLLERSFIYDSYANRVGKGTHKAIRRFQSYLRRYDWVLQGDIKKYFPSIDHEILKSLFRKKMADSKTLWLIDTIIDGSNKQEAIDDYFPGDDLFAPYQRRKGLPIGNLTSQFFANFYLNPFDHFVKEKLRCPAYLRYVDDFVLFSHSKRELQEWRQRISKFIEHYRLRLKPRGVHLYPARNGNRFLGQVVFRTHRRLAGENVRRFRKRLRKWEKMPPENLDQRIASWVGHAKQADTQALLKSFSNPMIDRLR